MVSVIDYKDKPTQEAIDEIKELEQKLIQNQEEDRKPIVEGGNWDFYQFQKKKIHKEWAKLHDKKKQVEELGVSSKQLTQIKRLLPNFNVLQREKDTAGIYPIGDNIIKEGLWGGLKIRVHYEKYSPFMRNVQGMGSLAGKIDIDKIEFVFGT